MDAPPEYIPRDAGPSRLAGNTMLVTGGDGGIGRAVSILFAREGANVAFLYLDEDEDAERTASLVEAEGARVLALSGDVRESEIAGKAAAKRRSAKPAKIGRASCRESVCQYVSISVVAEYLKKKH